MNSSKDMSDWYRIDLCSERFLSAKYSMFNCMWHHYKAQVFRNNSNSARNLEEKKITGLGQWLLVQHQCLISKWASGRILAQIPTKTLQHLFLENLPRRGEAVEGAKVGLTVFWGMCSWIQPDCSSCWYYGQQITLVHVVDIECNVIHVVIYF